MKRTVYAVAASLAFASASVYAQAQNPQPSRNDSSSIPDAPPSTPQTPALSQDPQPSNDDSSAPGNSAAGSSGIDQPSQDESSGSGGGSSTSEELIIVVPGSPTQPAAPQARPSIDE
jgi:hypothetical protein